MLTKEALPTVEIEHIWTKEVRKLEVIFFDEKKVEMIWPLAGLYFLELKTNLLRAASAKSRAKGTAAVWQAKDIEMVRRVVRKFFHPTDEVQKRMAVHKATMPFSNLPKHLVRKV